MAATAGAGPIAPGELQRRCGLLAVALSDGRRRDARLVTGEARRFGLDRARVVVRVPYPHLAREWTLHTLTCGVALQCAPSKDRVAAYALHELTGRQQRAVAIVEGRVALGWVAERWAGLLPELRRVMGAVEPGEADLDGGAIVDEALRLARSGEPLEVDPLLGRLPLAADDRRRLAASARRMYGRMPWSSRRFDRPRLHSIPVGGDGGVRDPNLPPPSRPEDEDDEVRAGERVGIPYPEWNVWTGRFLPDHVAVLERASAARSHGAVTPSPEVRRWFEQHTHRVVRSGLEDGADLDVGRYVDHHVDLVAGGASDGRVFRDLVPGARDVTTALLLDGSASLGAHHGRVFALELRCADWLSQAMTAAGERHGVFTFTGDTRHRVEVTCLKDFADRRPVTPSGLGLATGGYTRLGAPIRHLTSRLLAQPSERRLLILVGDGLMCDEGYEGRYAWADVAHAVAEADEAGVALYYIGVGAARVDPLPEAFGPRRSQRIRRVDELPRVLAHVHGALVAA